MVVTKYTGLDFSPPPSLSLFLTGSGSLGGVILTTFLLDSKLEAGEISKSDSAKSSTSGSLKSFFAWSTDVTKLGWTPRHVAKGTALGRHEDSSLLWYFGDSGRAQGLRTAIFRLKLIMPLASNSTVLFRWTL